MRTGLVARALRVRTGEMRIAGLLVALMFVSSASMTTGESGIDALFFERVGTHALPLMYLVQSAVTFAAMLGLSALVGRLGRRRIYVAAPTALGSALVAERAVLLADVRWIYPVLWVTVPLGMLVLGVVLWGTAGTVMDTRQAKRLFPILAAGGILGSVLGGLATRALADGLGAENLTLVWAAGLAAACLLVRLALGPAVGTRARRPVVRRKASARRDLAQGLAFVKRSKLLVWMTLAAVLFSVLFYSLYLPYAQVAARRFPDADRLAGFFGVFGAVVTGGAFLVSMLAANRLFAWAGVATVGLVLPLLYTSAFAVVLVDSGFVTLVAARFVIGVWLQGVASPGWETLVNVVPEQRRDQTRAFLNGGPTQAGTAIAGVVAVVGQQALTPRQLAGIGLAAALLTCGVALQVRRNYAGALLDALRAGRPDVFGPGPASSHPIMIERDGEAARALVGALRAEDVHVRRLAFELLVHVPAAERPAELLDGLEDPDATIRLVASRALDGSNDADRLIAMIDDPDPRVAAAAAARSRRMDARSADGLLEVLAHPDEEVRRSAIEGLRDAPGDDVAALASPLLDDPAPVVRAAAVDALAALAPSSALAAARAAIGDADPRVRISAGRALACGGDAALDEVLRALSDPSTSDAGVEAARLIEADGAAGRGREFARSAAERALADRVAASRVPAGGDAAALLRDALVDRGRRAARSALWALSIVGPNRAAAQAAIDGLDPRDPVQLANALETLEASGEGALVKPLLVSWEPLTAAAPGDGAWLRQALADDDALIRACAEIIHLEHEGGRPMSGSSTTSLSVIERVILLRTVPLFADLAPSDLERVAALAEERSYANGETIAAEGELGEDLHVVVEGTVRVVQDRDGTERDLARRTAGDVIGEMSIITRRPRVASLVAAGDVRTVRIGRREFESMLRERPDVALAVMRVLADRLGEEPPQGDG